MSDGFPNKPRILRGAFVEFGLSVPPLVVVFQFNPEKLARKRSLKFSTPKPKPSKPPAGGGGQAPGAGGGGQAPGAGGGGQAPGAGGGGQAPVPPPQSLRQYHATFASLSDLQQNQLVDVDEQTIGFDIRLDATDKLDGGDKITEQFGIAPQLSTLELMMLPKSESLLGAAIDKLSGKPKGFSFTGRTNPPLMLFVFGRKRVLPVNISSMSITETEFSTDLNPIRATVAVSLTVIEANFLPYLYSKAMTEAMSVLNLANIANITNVVVPG